MQVSQSFWMVAPSERAISHAGKVITNQLEHMVTSIGNIVSPAPRKADANTTASASNIEYTATNVSSVVAIGSTDFTDCPLASVAYSKNRYGLRLTSGKKTSKMAEAPVQKIPMRIAFHVVLAAAACRPAPM